MNIASISNTIKSLFDITRQPAPQVPGMLMAIGCSQKPGLSTIISTGNIVKVLNKHDHGGHLCHRYDFYGPCVFSGLPRWR